MVYKAHIREETGEIQTVRDHSGNTAELCKEFAISPLKDILYAGGLLHDAGKYQKAFQEKIDGAKIRVEHSMCGAIEAEKHYKNLAGLMLAYCIAGHHSGIPDGGYKNDTPDLSTLCGRLKRECGDYSSYLKELELPSVDEREFLQFLAQDCDHDIQKLVDKFAFLTRYCFSCLTDADSLDTAAFCTGDKRRSLDADFKRCLEKTDARLQSFRCETKLQKTRSLLQKQVFDKVSEPSEIYLMNMPTGSGKTLCSMKFALERALQGKKRIIYVIPYNSIIDQTAEVFEKLFGEDAEILRHQSTFSYDDKPDIDEDYREVIKRAAENWDAKIIITTMVQFFESVYGNKRGKLRKLHNMADSVLVFDEAHLMPQQYLQPCLEAVSFITRYLNSEAVFLTATMPDFEGLIKKYCLPDGRILRLVEDTSMFSRFSKCRYQSLGYTEEDVLLMKAQFFPSSLIIVNKRTTAKRLFDSCKGRKYHLSTYMTSYDRKRVIGSIRKDLEELEKDYPDLQNVPEEQRIIVISTSLIEAGVDLDFYAVFRELTGLDSILQAGGRCNREGKREMADVFIFQLESERGKVTDERSSITEGILSEYPDISCQESIQAYYERLFFIRQEEIVQNAMYQHSTDLQSIPFRTYAEKFELIDSRTVSLIVARDETSRQMVEKLRTTGFGDARKLQNYACTIYQRELDDLCGQHVADDFGTGIFCLINPDYYDKATGVKFEAQDYIWG